jgi:hypothetical protein
MTAAACAVSFVFAPLRGTPLAPGGDIAFAFVVTAWIGLMIFGRRWPRRARALWALTSVGAALQVAVPWIGWDWMPKAPPLLFIGPTALLVLAGAAVDRFVHERPRHGMLVLVASVVTALACWSYFERTRVRALRQGATNASIRVMRNLESRLRDGNVPAASELDGWGWPIRVVNAPGELLIMAPGAGGRFDEPRSPGPTASWEDDLVVGRNQAWVRWPPGGNFSSTYEVETWRDWRTQRWKY